MKIPARHTILKIGIAIFAILFVHSTLIYPGGSTADFDAVGFSWQHNYVCNLMNHLAMNGEPNPGRPFAITAIIILALTIAFFFYDFAKLMQYQKVFTPSIQYCGVAAMLLSTLLFTRFHDVVSIVSSILGAVAVVGVMRTLLVEKWTGFFISGVLVVLLLAANNFIYFTGAGQEYLALLQKWTFLIVLLWILVLHRYMINEKS